MEPGNKREIDNGERICLKAAILKVGDNMEDTFMHTGFGK